ncbi:acyl carrier protein [Kutzneria buriramensis]|uniref:Acyl carrier protein n=1 Tax=Kutzneria buriramensis TaxID=1045776 RepID=A0A3E0GV32_9PSEU|nr:acyl carrier protein [Kutzneria buriramensis]REH28608.1 acyl carrier protein [Kutzneria buriramensis]
MKNSHIHSQLVTIVAKIAEVDPLEVTPKTSLRDELDIDSLTMVDLVAQIQDDLGVQIEDEDLTRIRTVDDLVQYVRGRS